ncbi:MAG: hypothetical protein H6797_02745 [Candidatus Nomurabacteria bacterium]|nr:MAG: hypothetical protein H6797_02745 [Candidatus Nomurabacteria bacterium]
MYKKYNNKLWCFSPPVMLATLLIEFSLAFYTLWRYKMTTVSRLVTSILVGLGVFQLAEYMICGGLGLGHVEWVRTGYVAITVLPALGLHLVTTLGKANKSMRSLVWLAYGTAAAYVAYFVIGVDTVVSRECAPNYAIFDVHGFGALWYAVYYYGWLLVTVFLAAILAKRNKKSAAALTWTSAGYSAFIVPTTFANIVDPSTLAAIPSIMCGFAVLLALVLVWRVLPLAKVPVNKSTARVFRKA